MRPEGSGGVRQSAHEHRSMYNTCPCVIIKPPRPVYHGFRVGEHAIQRLYTLCNSFARNRNGEYKNDKALGPWVEMPSDQSAEITVTQHLPCAYNPGHGGELNQNQPRLFKWSPSSWEHSVIPGSEPGASQPADQEGKATPVSNHPLQVFLSRPL